MAYSFSLELKRLHEERERLKAEKYTMQAELRRKYGEGFHLCRHRAKLSLDRGRVSHAYQRLSNWLSRDGVQEVGKYQNCQVKAVPDDLRGQADECIHLQCKPALQPKLQRIRNGRRLVHGERLWPKRSWWRNTRLSGNCGISYVGAGRLVLTWVGGEAWRCDPIQRWIGRRA